MLSPTLFSIYVNDLVDVINGLQCGVEIDGELVAVMLYADDIVLLSETDTDMQRMLDAVKFMVQEMATVC